MGKADGRGCETLVPRARAESVRVVVIKTAFSACSRRGLVAKTVATK